MEYGWFANFKPYDPIKKREKESDFRLYRLRFD